MSYFGRMNRPTRQAANDQALIGVEGGFATRPCTVLDISDGGARLRLDDPAFVQPTFRLKKSPADGGRSCKIAWRSGKEMGVAFLPDLTPWP